MAHRLLVTVVTLSADEQDRNVRERFLEVGIILLSLLLKLILSLIEVVAVHDAAWKVFFT